MGPWPVLRYAMFKKGLTSFVKVYKEKKQRFQKCLPHWTSEPNLYSQGLVSVHVSNVIIYAQFLKITPNQDFFKAWQRNDQKLGFAKKYGTQIFIAV